MFIIYKEEQRKGKKIWIMFHLYDSSNFFLFYLPLMHLKCLFLVSLSYTQFSLSFF